MKFFVTLIISLSVLPLMGQQKGDYNWLMGYWYYEAGYTECVQLDFNENELAVKGVDTYYAFHNKTASYSDDNGDLLFYSNGCAVFNRNFKPMPNGLGLNEGTFVEVNGGCEYGYGGDASIIILNDPGNENGFYLLYTRYDLDDYKLDSISLLSAYVDMSLDGGLGDVVYKDSVIYDRRDILTGYFSAIRHANEKDWWFLTIASEGSASRILTYKVTEDGIEQGNDQKPANSFFRAKTSSAGSARFSPDGKSWAMYSFYNGLIIYDFDRCSGELTLLEENKIVDSVGRTLGCSLEWSPNSRFIYTVNYDRLHQLDLYDDNEDTRLKLVGEYNGGVDPFPTPFLRLVSGPDGKIYCNPTSGALSIHVIEKPNALDTNCTFRQNAIKLPYPAGRQLPIFPRYRVPPYDGECDMSASIDIHVDESAIHLYPNPTDDVITLEVNEDVDLPVHYKIIDVGGRLLMEGSILDKRKISLDMHDLPSSVYSMQWMSLSSGGHIGGAKRFIKR